MGMRTVAAAALALLVVLPGSGLEAAHPGHATDTVRLLPLPEIGDGAPRPSKLRSRFPWRIPRARKDRPNTASGPLVHVVYVTSRDRPAPPLDRLGILEVSLRAQNRWLRDEMGAAWRFDRFRYRPPGRSRKVRLVDVTFVPTNRRSSGLDTVTEVGDLLRRRGFDRPNTRYLAYVAADAGNVCGEAEYPLFEGNTGRYAAVFLYSAKGCGTRAFAPRVRRPSWSEAVTLHEFLHNDGVAPLTAPHTCGTSPGHICTAPLDLTDLDPEAGDLMFPYVTGPLRRKTLDRGRDDYLDHPWPHRDLRDSRYLR